MSIRALARDLYKAQQRVDRIKKEMEQTDPGQGGELQAELRFALKELELLRKMLDGEKESGEFRKRFSGFGRNR
jgi:hypothetical protein